MALVTQPNQKPALQDFTTWFESAKVMGVADLSQPDGPSAQPARTESVDAASDSGSSSLVESPGAPHSPASAALSAREPSSPLTTASGYFIPDLKVKELTVAGIRKILRALWPDDLPVQVETVEADYAKVFCILLRIAQGYFIEHFVKHDSLCDSKLPFEAKPPNFPPSPNDELFTQFYEIQWMFCAPTFRYNKINQEWNNYILPIILKEDLARGGTATTSKIMLHGAYNRLDPPGDTDKSKANLFVLKTYRTKDAAEHYKSEVEAYRKLRPIGNNSPGLTGFYGSFIHNGTFNIILEFADQGTLNEFFERVTPPSTTKDIRDFWSAMFNLIGAIMTIHNLQVQEENGQDEDDCLSFRGWHQDVKPDNILVTSGTRRSVFGCQFKLADLGLCHFRRIRSQRKGKKAVSREVDPADDDKYGTRIYGAPECYRPDDFTGTSRLLVGQSVDIWSLGCVYSEAVVWVLQGKEQLKKYRELRGRETRQKGIKDVGCFHEGMNVLDCVERKHAEALESKRECDYMTREVVSMVEDMLVGEDCRQTAKQLWGKSRALLRKADNTTRRAKKQRTNSSGQSQAKTPPESPVLSTASLSKSNPSAQKTPRHPVCLPQQSNSRGRPDLQIETGEPSFGIPRCESPSQKTTVDGCESLRFPGNGSVTSVKPAMAERTFSAPSAPQAHPQTIENLVHYAQEGVPTPQMTPSVYRRPVGLNKRNLTVLEVEDALHWIGKKKAFKNNPLNQMKAIGGAIGKNRIPPALPNTHLMSQLHNRDHVFLIDDSVSMAEHWNRVKKIFGILCYLVKESDKDGVDLRFTRHERVYNSTKSSELVQELDNLDRKLNGHSNMEDSLRKILEKHKQELQSATKSKSRRGRKKPASPMNLYVFTDGAWHSRCDAANPIRTFVNDLQEHWSGHPESKVSGIQFISFGDDPDGLAHLHILDSGLGDLERDIVDTEPSTGNVLKMLLGAINKTFDNDLEALTSQTHSPKLSNPPSFAKSM